MQFSALRSFIGSFFTSTTYICNDDNDNATDNGKATLHGNPYNTYATATNVLSSMCSGTRKFGGDIARSLVHLRAALTVGDGVVPRKDADNTHEKEFQFVENFLDYNNLRGSLALDWAQEAEIEGQILVILDPVEDKDTGEKNIKVRFAPWTALHYNVVRSKEDYTQILNIQYELEDKTIKQIPLDTAVHARFGGRVGSNEPTSIVANIAYLIEDLDRARSDWRYNNFLFSAQTPYFETETSAEAADLRASLTETNWSIGKAYASSAKYSLIGPTTTSSDVIEREITGLIKRISGATGVPVHYLGYPDLMSNRATADTLVEMVMAATRQERMTWKNFYERLFASALEMSNKEWQTGYDTQRVVLAETPIITAARVLELVETWLPLYEADAIKKRTLLTKVPGLEDIEAELEADADSAVNRFVEAEDV